jgi:hypothetical protein
VLGHDFLIGSPAVGLVYCPRHQETSLNPLKLLFQIVFTER